MEKFNLPFKSCLGKYLPAAFCKVQPESFALPSLHPKMSQFVTKLLKQESLCLLRLMRRFALILRVFGFGLKFSMTFPHPNHTTFFLPDNLVPMYASVVSVQLLAVKKNTQPEIICLPGNHFISHYQHRKFRASSQALRRHLTKTAPASFN